VILISCEEGRVDERSTRDPDCLRRFEGLKVKLTEEVKLSRAFNSLH
jgi:hypothetical protein